jgi:hypothetical protein
MGWTDLTVKHEFSEPVPTNHLRRARATRRLLIAAATTLISPMRERRRLEWRVTAI